MRSQIYHLLPLLCKYWTVLVWNYVVAVSWMLIIGVSTCSKKNLVLGWCLLLLLLHEIVCHYFVIHVTGLCKSCGKVGWLLCKKQHVFNNFTPFCSYFTQKSYMQIYVENEGYNLWFLLFASFLHIWGFTIVHKSHRCHNFERKYLCFLFKFNIFMNDTTMQQL
jgi:hypothetical protein